MKPSLIACPVVLSLFLVACGSSDDDNASRPTVVGGGGASAAGAGGVGGSSAAGSAGSTAAGTGGTSSAGGSAAGGASGSNAGCATELESLLKPIDATSTGEVVELSKDATSTTLFVDASAGGTMMASTNPRLYLSLATGKRVAVTDKTAAASKEWDLALKRPVLFTNGGQGGPGQGAAAFLAAKSFDAVTSADAAGTAFTSEDFLSVDCIPNLDLMGAVLTSFSGWYDYDPSTNGLAPQPGVWLVKGADAKLYKVEILGYYANPDGTTGMAGGRYKLRVGALLPARTQRWGPALEAAAFA